MGGTKREGEVKTERGGVRERGKNEGGRLRERQKQTDR